MFQRRGADHQHSFQADRPGEDLRSGNGLDGLAQAHVVGQKAAPGPGSEQGSLALVGIEFHLEQVVERRTGDAAGEHAVDFLDQVRAVADLGDQTQCIVVAADFVLPAQRLLEKRVKLRVGIRLETTLFIEVLLGEPQQPFGALVAGPECDLPLGSVPHVNLRVGRMKAGLQFPPRPGFVLQAAERELDVLAGAQRIHGKVGAGTVVLTQAGTADSHSVGTLALGVGHFELGKHRLAADVPDLEFLFAAVLLAQGDLPILQRHPLRHAEPRDLLGGCLAVRPRFPFRPLPAHHGSWPGLPRSKCARLGRHDEISSRHGHPPYSLWNPPTLRNCRGIGKLCHNSLVLNKKSLSWSFHKMCSALMLFMKRVV